MEMQKQVGKFTVEVWDPYPCSVIIRYGDSKEQELRFSHHELRDLEYALQTAIKEANKKLGSKDAV